MESCEDRAKDGRGESFIYRESLPRIRLSKVPSGLLNPVIPQMYKLGGCVLLKPILGQYAVRVRQRERPAHQDLRGEVFCMARFREAMQENR